MNAASILRNQQSNHSNSSVSNLSGMKTFLVRKDQQPVTAIMQMVPVNMSLWRKAVSFHNLRNTVHSLLEMHSITDVISLVSNELPIDTGTAFQESQEVVKMVTGNALRVENLYPSAFFNLEGKQLKFHPAAKLVERPEDLSYFRFQ